jgi:hypothetical protein
MTFGFNMESLLFSTLFLQKEITWNPLYYLVVPAVVIYFLFTNRQMYDDFEEIRKRFCKARSRGNVMLVANPKKRNVSDKFHAVCWSIQQSVDPSIYSIEEVSYKVYNFRNDEENTKSYFKVNQPEMFTIDADIYGKVSIKNQTEGDERSDDSSKKVVERFDQIEIFSNRFSTTELMTYLEELEKKHREYLLTHKLKSLMLVECSWDTGSKDFQITTHPWASNVTFDTRMFENKEEILSQIDTFLTSKELYAERGIPYHLGILLHGTPGCGKTSFIKALANYTQRHIIDIKLSDGIDLGKLKELILNERLQGDLLIPINKRIYVLEDIDVMGSIVHKRKSNKGECDGDGDDDGDKCDDGEVEEGNSRRLNIRSKNDSDKGISLGELREMVKGLINDGGLRNTMMIPTVENGKSLLGQEKTNENTMSSLLNILDGVQENPGRMIVMTTNHISKLDPAIIRPGRIDMNLNFKPASREIICQILEKYWLGSGVESGGGRDDLREKLGDLKPIPHCKVIEICRASKTIGECIEKLCSGLGSGIGKVDCANGKRDC